MTGERNILQKLGKVRVIRTKEKWEWLRRKIVQRGKQSDGTVHLKPSPATMALKRGNWMSSHVQSSCWLRFNFSAKNFKQTKWKHTPETFIFRTVSTKEKGLIENANTSLAPNLIFPHRLWAILGEPKNIKRRYTHWKLERKKGTLWSLLVIKDGLTRAGRLPY